MEDDEVEVGTQLPLIRTSTHHENMLQNQLWDRAATTAADYTHYVNPTITTSNASVGTAYTAAALGLTNSP